MTFSLDQQVTWLFRLNAVINVGLSLRGIFDPAGMAALFGGPVPHYPFLLRLWSGLILMFGLMFWEASRDVRKKAVLLKYNWIEKLITACAVTLGFVAGDVPASLMLLIFLTNWLWIPFILTADIRLRRDIQARSSREQGALAGGDMAPSMATPGGSSQSNWGALRGYPTCARCEQAVSATREE
jgi:hypothetical protein